MSSEAKKFKCEACGKTFPQNRDLQKHLQRKNPCALFVEVEDISDEKKKNSHRCRFCGRSFATSSNLSRHLRRSCKIVPRNGDTSGMDKLYEYTLKKQEDRHRAEMEALLKRVEDLEAVSKLSTVADAKALAAPMDAKVSVQDHKAPPNIANMMAKTAIVDQSTGKTVTNVTVNIFGGESTSHITPVDVLGLLRKLGPLGEDLCKPAERLILSMALMIYSDEHHPENITCYLPNKKGKDALIHGESGWEVMPISLTLSPMASKSVDALFKKQPWPGLNGVPADLNLDEPTRILRYIADHEPDLVGGAASPSSELRAIPIRNREILEKVLAKLPKAGDA
jgi:hypothetical protein